MKYNLTLFKHNEDNTYFFRFENNDIEFWFSISEHENHDAIYSVRTHFKPIECDSIENVNKIRGYIECGELPEKTYWVTHEEISIPAVDINYEKTIAFCKHMIHKAKVLKEVVNFFKNDFTEKTWRSFIPRK